jgi:hypothetical protein
MARVCGEARCEGFCSEEGPHYRFFTKCQEPAGTQAGVKSPWEGVCSCLLTSNNPRLEVHSRFQSWAVLRWLGGGLCHARKCQFKDKTRKGMIRVLPTDVCTRNLCKERQNGERKPVLLLVPGTHKRLTLRKRVMCARNLGAHKQRSIRSTKGKNGRRNNRSPTQPRKEQRN